MYKVKQLKIEIKKGNVLKRVFKKGEDKREELINEIEEKIKKLEDKLRVSLIFEENGDFFLILIPEFLKDTLSDSRIERGIIDEAFKEGIKILIDIFKKEKKDKKIEIEIIEKESIDERLKKLIEKEKYFDFISGRVHIK